MPGMLFHAEAYDKVTARVVADLGRWRRLKLARSACELHAREILEFKPAGWETWDAEGKAHIYRIGSPLD